MINILIISVCLFLSNLNKKEIEKKCPPCEKKLIREIYMSLKSDSTDFINPSIEKVIVNENCDGLYKFIFFSENNKQFITKIPFILHRKNYMINNKYVNGKVISSETGEFELRAKSFINDIGSFKGTNDKEDIYISFMIGIEYWPYGNINPKRE